MMDRGTSALKSKGKKVVWLSHGTNLLTLERVFGSVRVRRGYYQL